MHRLTPAVQDYAWGSKTALPAFAGWPETGRPVAEAWYGTHPTAPSRVAALGTTLRELVLAEPDLMLGADVVDRFGPDLPFLLKVIAPAGPLSLQVHPSREQAALGWVREERRGVPVDAAERTYRDANHKPEMVYALTTFEAVSGFRAPRRALEVLAGLDTPLIDKTVERLRHGVSGQGVRSAFEYVLLGARDRDADVDDVVGQITARLAAGASPSEHADEVALQVARAYPGDRGILASLLLNPVTLQPGEAMYVPAGCVHAYLSGLGVEVMASSDNVVRAGMTRKHIDARALLDIVDVQPAPPIRLAPEHAREGVEVFYAPVEDFELAIIRVTPEGLSVGGTGPRVVLAIEGEVTVTGSGAVERLRPAEAVYLAHGEEVTVTGTGRVVRASVP